MNKTNAGGVFFYFMERRACREKSLLDCVARRGAILEVRQVRLRLRRDVRLARRLFSTPGTESGIRGCLSAVLGAKSAGAILYGGFASRWAGENL